MSNWQDIGAVDDFSEDTPVPVIANGMQIAIFRLEEELFALHDMCTHGVARLSDGYVEDGCVECPLHQGLFDIRTGEPRCAPVTEAVRHFPVRVVAGRVEVAVAEADQVAAAPRQRTLTVQALQRPAPDVAVLTLAMNDAAGFAYQAGQYIDIVLGEHRRSYSIANSPGDHAALELHVRHMPGGLFTDQVFHAMQAGDVLVMDGPHGQFYLRPDAQPVILLASGTGFAPVKAIMESLMASANTRPVSLYWGGRRPQDIYHHALCLQWQQQCSWFSYVPVLSDSLPEDAWQGRQGLVHLAVMEDYPDLSAHAVYACGAPRMVEAAREDFTLLCALKPEAFYADAFLSQADIRR
jgi:anthranilate 1,2-dioxygenase ferredoxin component